MSYETPVGIHEPSKLRFFLFPILGDMGRGRKVKYTHDVKGRRLEQERGDKTAIYPQDNGLGNGCLLYYHNRTSNVRRRYKGLWGASDPPTTPGQLDQLHN